MELEEVLHDLSRRVADGSRVVGEGHDDEAVTIDPAIRRVKDAIRAGEADGQYGTRVLITSSDGVDTWDAGCISANIMDASFEALCSSAIMGIMRGSSVPA